MRLGILEEVCIEQKGEGFVGCEGDGSVGDVSGESKTDVLLNPLRRVLWGSWLPWRRSASGFECLLQIGDLVVQVESPPRQKPHHCHQLGTYRRPHPLHTWISPVPLLPHSSGYCIFGHFVHPKPGSPSEPPLLLVQNLPQAPLVLHCDNLPWRGDRRIEQGIQVGVQVLLRGEHPREHALGLMRGRALRLIRLEQPVQQGHNIGILGKQSNINNHRIAMPKEIKDIKEFMLLVKGDKDSKEKNAAKKTVFVKSGKRITKFKIRKTKYLYTFQTDKQNIAKKIIDSFASNNVQKQEIKGRRPAAKKTAKK